MSERYPHTYNPQGGTHSVGTTGELHIRFTFSARKHAEMYLRIDDVLVARQSFTGNLTEKIERARELLTEFFEDASIMRDVVDGGIARLEGRAKEARKQAELAERNAQFLRNLGL